MATRKQHVQSGAHMTSPNPRRHALEVISRALSPTGGDFARDLLDARLKSAHMKPPDARLAAELTFGVIRRCATLDAVLAAFSTQPIGRLDSGVRQILRIGIYQLLFLERVPEHAAVDESVRLTRAIGRQRATGFVNAVLRAVARETTFAERPDPARPRHSFELSPGRACIFTRAVLPPPAGLAAWLAAACSMPEWLMGRWLARYGTSRTRQLCATVNQPPPLFIRPNLLKTSAADLIQRLGEEELTAQPSQSGLVLRLPPHTMVARLATFREGLFQVQDEAAASVAPFLGPLPGETVLDLCAAPGGKTCHMAEIMECRGQIVAVDSSAKRLKLLEDNLRRLDLPIIATVQSDGANFAVQNRGKFDRVLLDAPCSNTGVLQRRVEARWRLSDKALAGLVRRQSHLLRAALRCLKPGGALVYSTCSMEPEENEGLVESVLRDVSGFRVEAQRQALPGDGCGDGAFMARIVQTARPRGVET